MINIVLAEPEIPQNTGNIARTCAATATQLHIIKPMGFEISDRRLKRAGLDYWHLLNVQFYEGYEDFFERTKGANYWFASTKAVNTHSDVSYGENDYIMFGKETKGLPEELLFRHKDRCVRIPMLDEARSLNLSNAVAVVVYEVLRQQGYKQLETKGALTRFDWELADAKPAEYGK